jgi:hypothetical protein
VLRSDLLAPRALDFCAYLRRHIATEAVKYPGLRFHLTGAAAYMKGITDSVSHDLSMMDAIVLPIAFIILAMVVRSLRLLIAPLLCIGASVALSFALVYAVSTRMTILSFVPSFMVRRVMRSCPRVPIHPVSLQRLAMLTALCVVSCDDVADESPHLPLHRLLALSPHGVSVRANVERSTAAIQLV